MSGLKLITIDSLERIIAAMAAKNDMRYLKGVKVNGVLQEIDSGTKIVNILIPANDDYDFSDQDVADIFADDVFDFEDFTQPDIDYVFEDDSFDFDGFTQDDIDFILDR